MVGGESLQECVVYLFKKWSFIKCFTLTYYFYIYKTAENVVFYCTDMAWLKLKQKWEEYL